MGTRSASGVRIGGVDKLSYNQFDGYPDGVGQAIVAELKAQIEADGYPAALAEWRALAEALRLVDESAKPSPEDFARHADAHDGSVSTGDDWYALLRLDQGSVLKRLRRGVATDGNAFVRDSLFCEWAYVVNLDDETLEIYRGSQTEPHNRGRYAGMEPGGRKLWDGTVYHPVALIATFRLDALPDNLADALEAVVAET